jgi:hypothetical protein
MPCVKILDPPRQKSEDFFVAGKYISLMVRKATSEVATQMLWRTKK